MYLRFFLFPFSFCSFAAVWVSLNDFCPFLMTNLVTCEHKTALEWIKNWRCTIKLDAQQLSQNIQMIDVNESHLFENATEFD